MILGWFVVGMLGLATLAKLSVAGAATAADPATTPDFSGVWEARDDYVLRMTKPDGSTWDGQRRPPLQPWTLDIARKHREADRAGFQSKPNNNQLCLPPGLIRTYKGNFPFMIVQTPTQMSFLFEENTRIVLVYINERHPEPAKLKPSYTGHSVGRWEGDTFIIDTIGTNGDSGFPGGIEHTDALHLTHRMRLIENGQALEDRVTIVDPKAYTAPWETLTVFERHPPEFRLREYVCAENNMNLPGQ